MKKTYRKIDILFQSVIVDHGTQFVIDNKGHKVAAVLPIDEYESLMEDIADLASMAKSREGETISFEDVKKQLIADGLLQS